MSRFQIEGGRPLFGSLEVQGAKNSVLPILAATLLCRGRCVLENCPRLRDVEASIRILESMGCRARWQEDALVVDTAQMSDFPALPRSRPQAAWRVPSPRAGARRTAFHRIPERLPQAETLLPLTVSPKRVLLWNVSSFLPQFFKLLTKAFIRLAASASSLIPVA